MSVLTCPVCQGPMREIERQGVLIDTCTQCRGVWLDRGELEKLAGAIGGPSAQPFAAAEPQKRSPVRRDYYDDEDSDDHPGRRPKSRTSRLLDFFD
jgi:uncharacterized protein